MAGAEIVHHDAHAQLAQFPHGWKCRFLVAQQGGFGDLELETIGGQARACQRIAYDLE
jgi:hypothetical protein